MKHPLSTLLAFAVIAAPNSHRVLLENDRVRVVAGVPSGATPPGEPPKGAQPPFWLGPGEARALIQRNSFSMAAAPSPTFS
jgi:hypothetical protein